MYIEKLKFRVSFKYFPLDEIILSVIIIIIKMNKNHDNILVVFIIKYFI